MTKKKFQITLGWFGMELPPLLLFVFSYLLLPLSEATCKSCLVRRSSLSWSTQWYFSESEKLLYCGVRLSENKKSLERKELWAYLYELTSGKALTWLRTKKMDPASLSHSPGWTFPLRVVGKRMIFMKKRNRWISFGWEAPQTTLMCQMDQPRGEIEHITGNYHNSLFS